MNKNKSPLYYKRTFFNTASVDIYQVIINFLGTPLKGFRTVFVDIYLEITESARAAKVSFRTVLVDIYLHVKGISGKNLVFSYSTC